MFVITGGICTLTGFAVFYLSYNMIGYHLAYALDYLVGIILSFTLNSRLSFKSEMTLTKFKKYAIIYAIQLSSALIIITVMVELLGINKIFSNILTTSMLILPTYLATRKALTKND